MNDGFFENDTELSASDQQRLSILKGVVVFVDVRNRSDNRSAAIATQLERLGATVAKKFDKDVTHVVFKDGTKATRDKAVKRGMDMVSVLWIESCKEKGQRVSEKDFIATLPEGYSTPTCISKFRKYKSMQPRGFEEDLASSVEKAKRRKNRIKIADDKDDTPSSGRRSLSYRQCRGTPITPGAGVLAPESEPRPKVLRDSLSSPQNLTIPDTPTTMMRKMERLKLGKTLESSDESASSSPLIKDPSQPLERRLFDVYDFVDDSPAGKNQKSTKSSKTPNDDDQVDKPNDPLKRRLLSTRDNITAPGVNSPALKPSNTSKPTNPGRKRNRNSTDNDKENIGYADRLKIDGITTTRNNKRRKTCDSSILASYSEHIGGGKLWQESKQLVESRRRSGRPTLKSVVDNISKSLEAAAAAKGNKPAVASISVLKDNSKNVPQNFDMTTNVVSKFNSRPSMFEFKTTKSKLNLSSIQKAINDFDSSPDDATNTGDVTADKTGDLSESFGDVLDTRKVQVVKPCFRSVKKRRSIVMTSLHTQEQEVVIAAVKSLDDFTITESVNDSTTHVVCGEGRRTINLLAGIARGCWIISTQWVLRSIENGGWLDETDYEMCDNFPAAKKSRLGSHKQNGGIFADIGTVHVNRECRPPKEQLENLLIWSGAQVTSCLRKAKINIVPDAANCHHDVINVSSSWVLDCIMAQEQLPMDSYTLYRLKREGSPEY